MRTDRSRKALHLCSSLAIATGLLAGASSARAQSFQGTATVVAGSATVNTAPSTTTVNVSGNAVINWAPTDTATGGGPIDFQPVGTTATFTSFTDFAVLNRILPTDPSRAVQFNGTVISQIQQTTTFPGGTVFFYSPGGVILGPTAVFNVGNLGLTSASPVFNASTGEFDTGNVVTFSAANPGTLVDIQPGAQINALQEGSYVAAFAPAIRQNGTVTVNGQAAYVAGEAGTITFSPDGLFDIQVSVGTDGVGGGPGPGNAIRHGGTTTGPASSGAGDNHRIYMVAIPKNTAIFNAINGGGQVGFDIAGAADVQGNAVVLSGGYNITDGQFNAAPTGAPNTTIMQILGMQGGVADSLLVSSAVAAKSFGSFDIITALGGTLDFAARVDALALTQARAGAGGAGSTINFASDVTLSGARRGAFGGPVAGNAGMDTGVGGTINVAGNLTLDAANTPVGPSGTFLDAQSRTGGTVNLVANGGAINVAGEVVLDASGMGSGNISSGSKGSGTGGTINVGAIAGGTLALDGNLTANADGASDDTGFLFTSGGNGTGGTINVFANSGNATVTVDGSLSLNAAGFASGGGSDGTQGGPGGIGTGGNINVNANGGTGNSVLVGGDIFAFALGQGGTGFDANGGLGQGGNTQLFAGAGGTIAVTGAISGNAGGEGGDTGNNGLNAATVGGAGQGGDAGLDASGAGGSITASGLSLSASGEGGEAFAVSTLPITGNGGLGLGGEADAFATAGGSITIDGFISLDAEGDGGSGLIGGIGQGGEAVLGADGSGALTLIADGVEESIFLSANGEGGSASVSGGVEGNGTGGDARIVATGGGTIDITTGNLFLLAVGQTEDFGVDGTDAGDGTGGTVSISQGTGGSVDITGEVLLSADGFGGHNYGGGDRIAGTGQGGDARIAVNDAGGIDIDGRVSVTASGIGGDGLALLGVSSGGAGFGGLSNLGAINGANTVTGEVQLLALGEGGDASLDGSGGVGVGGQALFGTVLGSTPAAITIGGQGGFTVAVADGVGGAAAGSGAGGSGTGGFAQIFASGGDVTINDGWLVTAQGTGGGAVNGNAGFGRGGTALITANSGTVAFTAPVGTFAQANASAVGGTASGTGDGGDAGAGIARLFVEGGNIAVTGDLNVTATAVGGDGVNGGDAISVRPFREPRTLIAGFAGGITVGGFTQLSSSAFGGNANSGGAGGIAFAGDSAIDSQSNSGATVISLNGGLGMDASASGGFGGDGVGSQAGGAGGDAYAGFAAAQGNAGRGDLTITGDSLISASAFGGTGGVGGSGGSTAPGANGGAGGRAFGGGITLGTVSGFSTPENDGSATFGNVFGDANAFGGIGGAGGTGATQGAGGVGGDAFGGTVGILVRGSPVTMGDVSLSGLGIGGDGGAGSVQGDGGDGYAGDGFVIVTQRFMRTERGSLSAGDVTITSGGIGGGGATGGGSFFAGAVGAESELFVRQSDVSLNSLTLGTSGDLAPGGMVTALAVNDPDTGEPTPFTFTLTAEPFDINLTDSTVDIAGDFTAFTPGEMRVSLGSSTLDTTNLSLSAGNFVLPATRPAVLGTINVANSLFVSSGLDFLAYANFTGGGDGLFSADGSVLTGDLTFGGRLDIDALGSITTSNVDAGDVFFTAGQAIATGAVTSDEGIELTAPGTIATGQLTAGDDVVVSAGGAVTVAGASAGLVNPSTDPAAEYNVVLRSLTSIDAGDLAARGSVGVGSPGAIAVGNVTTGAAGLGFLALAGTGLTTGAIDTTGSPGGGRVYVGNFSMEPLGGELGATFDPNPVLAAAPVAVAGAVTINGAVATGKLQANATQNLTIAGATTASDFVTLTTGGALATGAIQAANAITALANGAIAAGNLTAGTALTVQANGAVQTGALSAGTNLVAGSNQSLTTGNAQATGDIQLNAMGAIQTGTLSAGQMVRIGSNASVATQTIDAGDRVAIEAMGSLALGNVTAGIVNPSAATGAVYRIGLSSGGSIATGSLTARNQVLVGASQALATGAVSGLDAMLLAGTNITTGAITAGTFNPSTGTRTPNGRILLANSSLGSLGGTFQAFNPEPVFAASPVRVAGSIAIAGPASAQSLAAAAAQGFAAQAITLGSATQPGSLFVDAGGAVSVQGAWSAALIELASSDLDVAASGSLDASGGELSIVSTNPGQVLIGDGLSGSGYTLSNAEFGRIRGGSIRIAAQENSGQTVDLLIGDLTVNGSQLGSDGELNFVVGDVEGDALTTGLIRVNGNVAGTGFGADQGIDLTAGTIEVNAATGSLNVTGSANAISGYLELEGDRIHVASDEILLKLRDNPQYTGYIDELNAPAAVQRPEGVLRAQSLELEGNKSILIQNTGTGSTPAGFFAGFDENAEEGTEIGGEDTTPGGLDLVINGQLQTSTGILTGREAFDAAVTQAKADAAAEGETFGADLVETSTFNNCVILTGVCTISQSMAAAPPASEITVITGANLDDSPTAPAADDADEGEDGSSEDQEEEADNDEGSSPIAPPQPLINARPLNPDIEVVEPVSGAGNPALFGSAVIETTAQGDDQ